MLWREGDWIYLAQDGAKCQAAVNKVTNVFPCTRCNFLTGGGNISCKTTGIHDSFVLQQFMLTLLDSRFYNRQNIIP